LYIHAHGSTEYFLQRQGRPSDPTHRDHHNPSAADFICVDTAAKLQGAHRFPHSTLGVSHPVDLLRTEDSLLVIHVVCKLNSDILQQDFQNMAIVDLTIQSVTVVSGQHLLRLF